jgi:hypothetical protein
MRIDPISDHTYLQNIAFCDQYTDAYLSNEETSNSEAKGLDDEGRIKPARCKPR